MAGRVQENQPALRSAMLRQVDVVVVEPRAPETVAGEVWHPCAGRLRGSVVECRQGQLGWRASGVGVIGLGMYCAPVEMVEDALNDGGVFDTGDDLDVAATGIAGFDIDVEHALELLCLRHMVVRCWAFVLCAVESGVLRPRRAGVTAARWGLLGANTPWYRIRLTRGSGVRAVSRAMKSSGSKNTWVVPSRYGVLSS